MEPRSACQEILLETYGGNHRFALVRAALGSEPGEAEILTTSAGSVYASMSAEWIERTRASGRFGSFQREAKQRVAVMTLDAVIERY